MAIENSNKTLTDLDDLENCRNLSIPEENFRKILKKHLIRLLDYQKQYWKKRCTVRWVKFGDENTKFFQSVATGRYRKNNISNLQTPDGLLMEDHTGKEAVRFQAYTERLGTSNPPDMNFDLPSLIQPRANLDNLTAPFTTDEIDKVIREMPADRAPGPDGFSEIFLKACWPIIKNDFYTLCAQFHEGSLDLQSINYGLITLIPKTQSPTTVNDYRPITLLNYCLKLITKLLANRLQKVILQIIHRNQYGFIKGRSIQDCLAWAFQYIHQCQTSKRLIVLLKLDFAKAFDTIEHEPMINNMKHMGFNDKWLSWIKCIFSSGRSSVLLNGVPGREFHCRRGVRQGDPLSPLILVLAADLLQSAINDAYRRGLIQLPFPCVGDMDYPVIQYADDTILLMPACAQQAATIKGILSDYAQSIGLKINFQKSTLIPINLDASLIDNIASIFGCSVGTMPFTYLGLPMGSACPLIQDFMPLVSSTERRLSSTLTYVLCGEAHPSQFYSYHPAYLRPVHLQVPSQAN